MSFQKVIPIHIFSKEMCVSTVQWLHQQWMPPFKIILFIVFCLYTKVIMMFFIKVLMLTEIYNWENESPPIPPIPLGNKCRVASPRFIIKSGTMTSRLLLLGPLSSHLGKTRCKKVLGHRPDFHGCQWAFCSQLSRDNPHKPLDEYLFMQISSAFMLWWNFGALCFKQNDVTPDILLQN